MGLYYNMILDNLPEKPFLFGRDKNNRSAVFVPFAIIEGTEYVIFEKRAKGIRQEGEICFPGGMVDPETDRSAGEAAVRETSEELGIAREKITLARHAGYLVANMGTTIDVFIGELSVEGISDIRPNHDEVESVHMVPYSFFLENSPEKYLLETDIRPTGSDENGNSKTIFPARELGLPEKYHNTWTARKTPVYVYKYKNITIWGLTASIIRELTGYAMTEGGKL